MADSSRKPRLLVLGAGAYQVPAIIAARRLGIRVIAVDRQPDAVGAGYADAFAALDTVDGAAVLDLARREGIDGVIAPCTDVAIATQALICDELGLQGPSRKAAATLTDKAAFRSYQQRRGLPHPRFVEAPWRDIDRAPGFGAAIVKPARSSGSKGIFIVGDHASEARLAASAAFDPDGRVILEQVIGGSQGTVEGLWSGGRIEFYMITDRLTAEVPHVATAGHRWPSRMPDTVQSAVLAAISDVLADLAVGDTAFDCDFVSGPSGPVILELTPRLGGNSLSSLVLAGRGRSLPADAVRCALDVGTRTRLRPAPEQAPLGLCVAIVILHVRRPGTLLFDERGARQLQSCGWVGHLQWDYPSGTPVRAFANGRDRVGEILLHAPTRDDLDMRCAEAETLLFVRSV
jgi:biotin carboxylase